MNPTVGIMGQKLGFLAQNGLADPQEATNEWFGHFSTILPHWALVATRGHCVWSTRIVRVHFGIYERVTVHTEMAKAIFERLSQFSSYSWGSR